MFFASNVSIWCSQCLNIWGTMTSGVGCWQWVKVLIDPNPCCLVFLSFLTGVSITFVFFWISVLAWRCVSGYSVALRVSSHFLFTTSQWCAVLKKKHVLKMWSCFTWKQVRHLLEVVPPDPVRYIIGAAIMMLGVVLPVGYMMFRTKRVPTSSVYAKQM